MGHTTTLRYSLDLDQIQGDIVPGFKKDHQGYLFFEIKNAQAARTWLQGLIPKLARAQDVASFNRLYKLIRARAGDPGWSDWISSTWVNVAFSAAGLQLLRAELSLEDREPFSKGLAIRAVEEIGFHTTYVDEWEFGRTTDQPLHGVLIVGADDADTLEDALDDLQTSLAPVRTSPGGTLTSGAILRLTGATLGGGKEHFGFRDGISQPSPDDILLDGWDREEPGDGGTPPIVAPGELILGYPDETDPTTVPVGSPLGEPVRWHSWETNGSYLAFMKIEQFVHDFRKQVQDLATASGVSDERIMAKVAGRWRTGARLRPAQSGGTPPAWSNAEAAIPASSYLEDPDGKTVPLGAHIRKANPRIAPPASMSASDREDFDARRHRIVRRSVPFGKALPDGQTTSDGLKRGILFAAYQADVHRQFEHVLGKWLGELDFSPIANGQAGVDPVVGDVDREPLTPSDYDHTFNAGPGGPEITLTYQRYVFAKGGAYFFAPSIGTLTALANGDDIPDWAPEPPTPLEEA